MQSTRKAVFKILAIDAQLTALAPGGVHYSVAPGGTPHPFVVFKQQSGRPFETFGDYREEREVWFIKAVAVAAAAKSGAEIADEIRERIRILMHDAVLELPAGQTLLYCRREDRTVDYQETSARDEAGTTIYTAGDRYRIEVQTQ